MSLVSCRFHLLYMLKEPYASHMLAEQWVSCNDRNIPIQALACTRRKVYKAMMQTRKDAFRGIFLSTFDRCWRSGPVFGYSVTRLLFFPVLWIIHALAVRIVYVQNLHKPFEKKSHCFRLNLAGAAAPDRPLPKLTFEIMEIGTWNLITKRLEPAGTWMNFSALQTTFGVLSIIINMRFVWK